MAEHDLKGDKLQINSIGSKEQVRVNVKNILTYTEGHSFGDLDLITKYAVEQMIAAAPGLGNRFPLIILTDDDDNEIGRITTDKTKCIQLFSVTGELLQQWCPTTAPVIVDPVELDIAFTLSENEPDFLDLNLHFRAPDGSVLSDHYSEGGGLVGDGGGVKPIAGQMMSIELTYGGGELGPGDIIVTPWDGPVKVTLAIRKNGVWFDGFVKEYPTPPAVGSLGFKPITPLEGEIWDVLAKAEPYTVPDEISDVDAPPINIVTIDMTGGTDTITDGEASFIFKGEESFSPQGTPLTHKWTILGTGITLTAP